MLNSASSGEHVIATEPEPPFHLYGGGAATFYLAVVNITDSMFEFNSAQLSGGAIFGGSSADITVDGCVFRDNTTPGYGAAIAASSAVLTGNTKLTNNKAEQSGGGVSKFHGLCFGRIRGYPPPVTLSGQQSCHCFDVQSSEPYQKTVVPAWRFDCSRLLYSSLDCRAFSKVPKFHSRCRKPRHSYLPKMSTNRRWIVSAIAASQSPATTPSCHVFETYADISKHRFGRNH